MGGHDIIAVLALIFFVACMSPFIILKIRNKWKAFDTTDDKDDDHDFPAFSG
ncbi:MAG: hypothetical protein Q7R98_03025 [Candidatus Jorgensenbacteria bacterium]|nr:hypothetical protein [Candidatus Jorgensenbacteria bacterium]